ncbi:MAG: DUF368 domain-containing protein [Mobilicoccus sp.]|nr:DUF368 domain-containing protein [Mobilicoccus sp.]
MPETNVPRPDATTPDSGSSAATVGLPEVPNSARVAPAQVVRGFVMGAADIVPGVSGGTVAFALGIYHMLIAALDRCVDVVTAVLRFDGKGIVTALKAVPWVWIISLGVGILTAVFVLADVLERALHSQPLAMAGLFMGLILGACVLCWRQLRSPNKRDIAMLVLFAIGFFLFLGIAPTGGGASATPPLWGFFLAGSIAICAMLLPGISGSFLLVLMGMYPHVLSAVSQRDFVVLAVFALGCAVGISLAARGLKWLLIHHHDLVVAAMIGIMVGSLRILWPWPGGLDSTTLSLPTADTWLVPTLCIAAGLVVVIGVDALARRTALKERPDTDA